MNYQDIKTWEDVCKANKEDPALLPDVSALTKEDGEYIVDHFKLIKTVKAIRGNWLPDFGNHDQPKYFPYFYNEEGYKAGSGGGFSYFGFDFDCTTSYVGARLCFETQEQAEYAGRTFIDLYKRVLLEIK